MRCRLTLGAQYPAGREYPGSRRRDEILTVSLAEQPPEIRSVHDDIIPVGRALLTRDRVSGYQVSAAIVSERTIQIRNAAVVRTAAPSARWVRSRWRRVAAISGTM